MRDRDSEHQDGRPLVQGRMILAVIGLSAIFPFGGPTIGLSMVPRGRCIGEDTVCPLTAFLVVLPDVSDRMVGNLSNDGLAKEAR